MWLKFGSAGTRQGIFSSGGENLVYGPIGLWPQHDYLYFTLNKPSSKWHVRGDISELTNQWIHVMGTWDEEKVNLYVNGSIVDSSLKNVVSASVYTGTQMKVGKFVSTNGSTSGGLTLDEWYFWDRTLTAEQVRDVYEAYLTGINKDMLSLKIVLFKVVRSILLP